MPSRKKQKISMAAVATPPQSQPSGGEQGPPQGGSVVPAVHNSSLYVGDVDKDVTEAQLYDLFVQVRSLLITALASRGYGVYGPSKASLY